MCIAIFRKWLPVFVKITLLNFSRQQFSRSVMVTLITTSVNRDVVCSCCGSEWRTHWTRVSLLVCIINRCHYRCCVELILGIQFNCRFEASAWIRCSDTRGALWLVILSSR